MSRRGWIACAGVAAAVIAYLAIPAQEIWLAVPEDLRGAVVFAGDRRVAVIDQPDLTQFRLWRRAREVRIEKSGFEPVVVAVRATGKSYLVVEQGSLIRTPYLLGEASKARATPSPTPVPMHAQERKTVPPQLLKHVEPEVPRDALVAGTPILTARISEKGDVVDVGVVRSVGKNADKYYVNALRQWKYRPATVDGKPVASDLTVTMMIRPQ